MISFALFSALATFYFTMFFTPGPNNAMLTASGMKFGFVRTLPHLIGIPLGHIFQIGLTCFGLANLFLIYPQIQFYMKILCFIYLLYLFTLPRVENDWLIFYGSKRDWKTIKILRSIIIPIHKSKSLVNCSYCCIGFFSY